MTPLRGQNRLIPRLDSHDAHHASGDSLFCPMGKKQIAATSRAQRRCVDILRWNSCGHELTPVCFNQIEKNCLGKFAVAGSPSSEKKHRIFLADRVGFRDLLEQVGRIAELRFKLSAHLRPHRIATFVDARPDGSLDILWPSTKAVPHLSNALLYDPLHRSAPARVKNPHCPEFGVYKNHRKAVGSLNGEQNARL